MPAIAELLITDDPSRVVVVTRPCSMCDKPSRIELAAADVRRYLAGALVQDVWPDMPKEQREVLMSGIHGPCFARLFPPEPGWVARPRGTDRSPDPYRWTRQPRPDRSPER